MGQGHSGAAGWLGVGVRRGNGGENPWEGTRALGARLGWDGHGPDVAQMLLGGPAGHRCAREKGERGGKMGGNGEKGGNGERKEKPKAAEGHAVSATSGDVPKFSLGLKTREKGASGGPREATRESLQTGDQAAKAMGCSQRQGEGVEWHRAASPEGDTGPEHSRGATSAGSGLGTGSGQRWVPASAPGEWERHRKRAAPIPSPTSHVFTGWE